MITRFDHAVIGVRDLDAAIRRYRELGFDVSPGGRHTGRGTYNAIIRFGLDYLELISVYDEAEAIASGPHGSVLVDLLRKREGSLVGYALATMDIAEEADRLQRTGLAAEGPFAMQRLRPDGHLLSWRLLVPQGVSWRRPWPFFIQWDLPDEQRLAWERPGAHVNGATSVAAVTIVVQDLERGIDLYQRQLGLELLERHEFAPFAAQRARFHVGAFGIELLTPTGSGPVQQMLTAIGEGPFILTLTVRDLEQTRTFLAQGGADLVPAPRYPGALLLPPDQALGVRLILTA